MMRREFLRLAAGSVAASVAMAPPTTRAAGLPRLRAIVFDAFPIFDPRPVGRLAEALFPGKGSELADAWRTRQFEYQWLRALSGQYVDFWRATEDGLAFAARQLELDLSTENRELLMQSYLELEVWPDVLPALSALQELGLRLGFLSNMTTRMLAAGIGNSGLDGAFEHVLSTDRIRTYKPDPRAYQMAIDAFELERAEILFVAFAGWDAAGAKWFGYPAFWVNRSSSPLEELGVSPDGVGRDLTDLVEFVKSSDVVADARSGRPRR